MICPAKLCKQETPDDSLYCDQCGIQILRCSKCGNIGTSKFCGKCGGTMTFKETTELPPHPEPQERAKDQPAEPSAAATVLVPPAAKKMLFCHPDGWNLEIADGDILGRTIGNHTEKLGAISVISGSHAKITFENDAWYITDQKSTNKTYVGSVQAQPGVPVKIKNNDVVQLANIKFIVRET